MTHAYCSPPARRTTFGRSPLLPAALIALALPASANDAPGPGFGLEPALAPPIASDPFGFGFDVYGVSAQLRDGRVVTFDGQSVLLRSAEGHWIDRLYELTAPTFPAFVRIAPDESFALLAESSTGGVHRVALDGSGGVQLADLVYPYDADFDGVEQAVLSAAPCFGCGTELLRIDTASGATTLLASVGGHSGPVAIDAAGDLFYAQFQSQTWLPKTVLRFRAHQLTGGTVLHEGDAEVVASGLAGASAMVADPHFGGLLLAENDSNSGSSAIVRIGGPESGSVVLQGTPHRWIADLQVVPGPGPGVFHPFQPASGGALFYTQTDFDAGKIARRALVPRRPQLGFSGVGTAGLGPAVLAVEGGPAFGTAVIAYGSLSAWGPEQELPLPGLPWVAGFAPHELSLHVEPLFFDGDGNGSLPFDNLTGATQYVVAYAVCADAGGALVGLSTGAAF